MLVHYSLSLHVTLKKILKNHNSMKYRRKPVLVEAIQWDGTYSHSTKIKQMFPEMQTASQEYHMANDSCSHWKIMDIGGSHYVNKGDYIIKNDEGDFNTCSPDLFERLYEKVEDQLSLPLIEFPHINTNSYESQ